jgi:CBS domain-containing protein
LLLSKIPAKEAMNTTPFTVFPDTDIIDAAQLPHDKKLYALCVVDEHGHLKGIFTISDILEAFIATWKNPLTSAQ